MSAPHQHLRDIVAEQALAWHVEHRSGELDERQKGAFLDWLKASPLHIAEYLAVTGLARDTAAIAQRTADSSQDLLERASREPDESTVWLLARSPTPPSIETGSPYTVGRRRSRASLAAPSTVAASVAVLTLAIGGSLWFLQTAHRDTYATRHGEDRSLQLPDSTMVRLNSDSTVAVHYSARERRIELQRGQAYFEVAKDTARPFIVDSGDTTIRAVGTQFDVYLKESGTTVTVVEGRVAISSPHTANLADPEQARLASLLLVAGEQITATPGLVHPARHANLQQATAWTRQEIVFEHQALSAVATEFNRYNRQQLKIQDKDLAGMQISGLFHTHDIATFTEFLNGLPGVHAQLQGERIVVTK